MKKITKLLLFIVVLLLVACFLLSGYADKKTNMELKIGGKIGGGELSIKEYYTLVQCLESYKNYIMSGETNKAYNMLGGSYRKYVPFNDYESQIRLNNFSNFIVKDIKAITQTTFETSSEIDGEEVTFLIIIDNDSNTFAIYPEGFIDKVTTENVKFSKKKLKCNVLEYKIYNNECSIDIEFENSHSNKSLEISEIVLNSTDEDKFIYDQEIILNPGEKKVITLNFDTDYDFPQSLNLVWNIGSKEYKNALEF